MRNFLENGGKEEEDLNLEHNLLCCYELWKLERRGLTSGSGGEKHNRRPLIYLSRSRCFCVLQGLSGFHNNRRRKRCHKQTHIGLEGKGSARF